MNQEKAYDIIVANKFAAMEQIKERLLDTLTDKCPECGNNLSTDFETHTGIFSSPDNRNKQILLKLYICSQCGYRGHGDAIARDWIMSYDVLSEVQKLM